MNIVPHLIATNHQNIVPINDKSYVKLFKYEGKVEFEVENEHYEDYENEDKEKHEDMVEEDDWRGTRQFSCNQCDKRYMDNTGLNRHIQRVHDGVKFSCDQCDKQFAQKWTLKMHIESVHSGIEHFYCNLCDKLNYCPNHG